MKVTDIPFVGYPVTDIDRSRNFYENILGLQPSLLHELEAGSGKYWIEYTIGPGCLAISNTWPPSGVPGGPTMALELEDIEAALAELEAHGFLADDGMMESPVCHFCIVNDPDGNPLCLHQMKP